MHKHLTHLFILGVTLAASGQAAAQDDEPAHDDNTRKCISVRSIRNTDIIDDRNILFHTSGKRVYHNILPRRCSGLAREDRFSYSTTIGSLCDLDTINVLHRDISGFRQGIACRIGLFHEITEEDAKALKEGPATQPQAKPLPMPTPKEIGVDEDGPDKEGIEKE